MEWLFIDVGTSGRGNLVRIGTVPHCKAQLVLIGHAVRGCLVVDRERDNFDAQICKRLGCVLEGGKLRVALRAPRAAID